MSSVTVREQMAVPTDIRIEFQPILNLNERRLLGYESLSRGPLGSEFENSEVLFRKAREANLTFELERECQRRLISQLKMLPPTSFIFVNLEPILLQSDDFLRLPLIESIGEIDPRNIVIELTERHSIRDMDLLSRNIDRLREFGFKIALDDVGSGYSDLDSIVEFLPDFIKISNRIIKHVALNVTKQTVISLLLELAEQSYSFLIAEGIESHSDYETLKELGVPFGQGYLLGNPWPEMIFDNRIKVTRPLQTEPQLMINKTSIA
jgi:EAL domain-containing protein (putative c-di-GMP-specific phosphodiesterase class I)